ncbi:MAG: preprotein translocase subunit SecA [Myxococcales bacterium]|nr:preprotein translocase subunit SecA [Myxococcales bacterium]
MIAWLLQKILGTKHDREIKKLGPKVDAINKLESKIQKLTDAELKAKTAEFKQKIDNGATVDDLLIEAFAVCREGGKRALGMRHYDVQLIGGMVLNRGAIAEMKTGEGKTLVATLAAYLNALEGKGVHIVTVNDYLARRDAEWMGKLYGFLGLTTGVILNGQGDEEKRLSYRSDITYGQNNEFGFDYLRDNMKYSVFECAQRPLHYAIVDEVDSILIDEARTPLIISGQPEASTTLYVDINKIIPYLKKDEHYVLDEKAHQVTLTDEGIEEAERRLKIDNLYNPENIEHLHVLNQCLRAHTLYKKGVNYLVQEGKVNIVDEFTGRVLAGRRWSDGLHQAVEAKEYVRVQEENRTLATITFQNLFRIYKKLGGMTGTADTEAEEFHSIYKLDVVPIPTNKKVQRIDADDLVYKTEREKFEAVAQEIADCVEKGQPVLVGTTSVAKSEAISALLTRDGVAHEVLNAKQHEREAYIVAQAGKRGAVTVATNMAGRGTDILLGGNAEMIAKLEFKQQNKNPNDPALAEELAAKTAELEELCKKEREEVRAAGGLHIVGTERHESRRIDNQLRGRSGRQGDPGSSRFFLSLEDDLMRIFAGERVQAIMDSLGMEEGVPIEHPWVTKSVENAQKKVEARNFDIRKNLLDYDDVMNQQRKAIYGLRREVLEGKYVLKKASEDEEERSIAPLDEASAERSDKIVEQMLCSYPEEPDQVEKIIEQELQGNAIAPLLPPVKTLDELKAIQPFAVEREVYSFYGVRPEGLHKHAKDPKKALEFVQEKVRDSLAQQRERLLDLCDTVSVHIVSTHAPDRVERDDWNIVAMANGFIDRFGPLANDDKNLNRREDSSEAKDAKDGDESEEAKEKAKIAAEAKAKEKAERDERAVSMGLVPQALSLYEMLEALGAREDMARLLYTEAEKIVHAYEDKIGLEQLTRVFRSLMLEDIDKSWIDHLTNMDHLRDGIGLRGYGQRDPKLEFKKEGFDMFKAMMSNVSANVAKKLFHLEFQSSADIDRLEAQEREQHAALERSMRAVHPAAQSDIPEGDLSPEEFEQGLRELGIDPEQISAVRTRKPKAKDKGDAASASSASSDRSEPSPSASEEGASAAGIESVRSTQPKIGRNDPCFCGSGKKYKKCHGASEASAD